MDRPLLILYALLLNAALAGPRQFYAALGFSQFMRLPGSFIRDIERKLNREHRSLEERKLRGTVLTIAIIIVSLVAGWIGGAIFHHFQWMELFIVTAALPVRSIWDRAAQMRRALSLGDLAKARQALEGTPWRHHALLDESGLARAAIETLSVHFSEKIIAPILGYALLGLPGLFLVKSVTLLEEMLAQPGYAEGFHQAPQLAHTIIHYVPSRLAAILWLAASIFLPSGKWGLSAKEIGDGMAQEPPHIMSLLAAASTLRVTLGGPASVYANKRWIGSGARATPGDIRRALYLFALLHLLLFILLGFFL